MGPMGGRMSKSARQFRSSVPIDYTMAHGKESSGKFALHPSLGQRRRVVRVLSAIDDSLHLYLRLAAVRPMFFTGSGTFSVART